MLFEAFVLRGYLKDGIERMSLQYFKTQMSQASQGEIPHSQSPSNIYSLLLLDILHSLPGKPKMCSTCKRKLPSSVFDGGKAMCRVCRAFGSTLKHENTGSWVKKPSTAPTSLVPPPPVSGSSKPSTPTTNGKNIQLPAEVHDSTQSLSTELNSLPGWVYFDDYLVGWQWVMRELKVRPQRTPNQSVYLYLISYVS